jgi:hypothetical protein
LFGKFDQENQRGMCINLDASNNQILCEWTHEYPENWISVASQGNRIAGQWHHLVVSYDGSSSAGGVRIYLDSQTLSTTIFADKLTESVETTVPVQIGTRGGTYRYGGAIDDLRIYKRILAHEEVKQMYEAGLRSVANIAAENRDAAQQELLTKYYATIDEPLIRLQRDLAASKTTLRDSCWTGVRRWYINGQGQMMVVIPNAAVSGESSIDHNFAIASHEVTVAEFRRFRHKHEVLREVAPTGDCPVHSVSWYDAAAYCNWLSEQEGIPEDEWVYEPNGNGQYADGVLIRENAVGLLGYRLPTDAEWAFACGAGSSGSYGHGESVALLEKYARYVMNSFVRSYPVGSLLPNETGLFEMQGNLLEWVQTPYSGSISPVRVDRSRVLCGGAFNSRASDIRLGSRNANLPDYRALDVGFRPARTYRLSP